MSGNMRALSNLNEIAGGGSLQFALKEPRAAQNSSLLGLTRASTSVNQFSATWWPFASLATSALQSSDRPSTSGCSPSQPHDLTNHRCINLRDGSTGPYRWELERNAESLVVDVKGLLVLDNAELMISAAIGDRRLGPDVLVRRTRSAAPRKRHARTRARRLVSAALAALIEMLRR
jgi:hypothetical protein